MPIFLFKWLAIDSIEAAQSAAPRHQAYSTEMPQQSDREQAE